MAQRFLIPGMVSAGASSEKPSFTVEPINSSRMIEPSLALPQTSLGRLDADVACFGRPSKVLQYVTRERIGQLLDADRPVARKSIKLFARANLYEETFWPTAANFPCPEQPEALTMPANDGFRPDDDQGRSPIAPDFAQPSPEEPISGCQFRPLHRATQDAELVPKCKVFQLKGGSRFEGYRRGSGQHVKRAEHRAEEFDEGRANPMVSFNSLFTIPTMGKARALRCLRSADFQPCSPLQSDFAPAPGKQTGSGCATDSDRV